MALDYRVFMHSYDGWNSTSTLFYGERDAVLVDPPQLLSDAHRLTAELLLIGKNLTHVYVSHFHPDHHFGSGVIQYAFPRARVVALPSVVEDIVFTTDDKVDMWGDVFGRNEPEKVLIPMPLAEPRLELEGYELEFSDGWEGDCPNNSVVWVPSLRVVCATDVAELDSHLWTGESDAARRQKWRDSINELREFDARVIIPGHCSPEAHQTLDGTSCIEHSLHYLDVYEEVLATAKTGEELVAGVMRHFPGMKTEDFGLEWQARLLFPKSCPDSFAPLPGKPGEIFLDPHGEYLGEPPRE
ncbi:MAG: MBL fold metallo-hydrolase [Actinobacteria bacterium]|jgi:glyoxylase-like metal-dependent hydrolase (beta-lactamase superfamily II)|nr:MBL fold metallo-hydrolase [Actinomycetota bacterium]